MTGLDLSPLWHAVMALALQYTICLVFGIWDIGGAIGCLWFIAREHTQAEYRCLYLQPSTNTEF